MTIETGQKKLSWGWLFLLSIPVATFAYVEKCSGTAMTFTLKKYIDSPAWILFLTSMNSLFAIVIAPWAACKSDQVCTWIGRRKNIIAVGFVLLMAAMVWIPSAGSFGMLVVLILLYQCAVDLGYTGPWKPLYFDLVPKAQRGRGMIINRYASIAARFIFMFFLIGRFDEQIGLKKTSSALSSHRWASLTGEQVIYYTGAVLVLVSLGIILLLIKEPQSHPEKSAGQKRMSLRHYLCQIVTVRKHWLMCVLVVSSVLMSTKLMTLRPLLITEQFGYSKQVFGNMHATTMLVNTTFILPVLIFLIDRIDKFKLFAVCIFLSTLHPAVYWSYVKFFAPGHIPPIAAIIAFNIADSAFDRTAILALWPFLFDHVVSDKKGFMNSMFLIAAGVVKFFNTNLLGLWTQFLPRLGGSSDRIDYMNGYLYIFAVGIIGCIGVIYFARHRHELPHTEIG